MKDESSGLTGPVGMKIAFQPETMESNRKVCAAQEFAEPRPIIRWLMTPMVDKALAIVAVLPFVYPIAMHFRHYMKIGEIVYLAEVLLLIGTMVSRRTPVRITTNPFYCLLACVASYWGLLVLSVKQPGRPLISPLIILPIYLASVFLVFWGRISLGRNIGMLPAQREIVERGAYRWMRHPIYTAYFFSMIAGILDSYSLENLLLYSLGIFWFVIRSLTEEEFLRADPLYSAYMQRVRARWVPGLI